MIDKFIYAFFGKLDIICGWVDKLFENKKKKSMKVSENTNVAMPIKNMIGIIVAVSAGIFAYTELTARLTSLETSRELMQSDLLKASDQKPVDQEQFLIQESLASDLEKTIVRVDEMMHNGVNIQRMIKDIERLRDDVEKLKDKVRENGNGYSSNNVSQ